MFNLKMKKISIIAGVIASSITLSTFSGFAAVLPAESLTEQIIGSSTEVISSSEQKVDNSINVSEDFVNEEIIEDSLPKVIDLNTPGDYRLVGEEAASASKDQDPNAIIVNTNDTIFIQGDGKYNITLDNVNIKDKARNHRLGPWSYGDIEIRAKEVNLTLVGKNSLKGSLNAPNICRTTLTIGASSEGSLDIEYGIRGTSIIVNSGNITTRQIDSEKLVVNGGNITATNNDDHAIESDIITINGGDVQATSHAEKALDSDAIYSHDITINGGNVQAKSNVGNAIYSNEVKITGGNITTVGKVGINGKDGVDLTISGGNIMASECDCGIQSGGNIKISGGNVTTSAIKGKVTISGGNIITSAINGNDVSSIINSEDVTVDNNGNIMWGMNRVSLKINEYNMPLMINSNGTVLGICSPDKHRVLAFKPIRLLDIEGNPLEYVGSKYSIKGGTINGVEYVNNANNANKMKNIFKSLSGANKEKSQNPRNYFSDCEFIFHN